KPLVRGRRNWRLPVVRGIAGALAPAGTAAPFEMAGAHVGAVADAEEERSRRPVGVFVHLAGRMHDKGAGGHRDTLARRAHDAAALDAEINFGGVGVAMIRADLAGLPARHGEVAVFDPAEDLLDMLLRLELGFIGKFEDLHCYLPDLCRTSMRSTSQ